MPPEMITADFLQKSNGFKEPILVPGTLNPRAYAATEDSCERPIPSGELEEEALPEAHFEYETVVDDGQDRLDMVIPRGLTVRRVAELYGPNETVPVIDVKAQEGEGKKWTMSKWADYYEQQGEKPVRNVISLEVSRSRLGKLIRRPKAVRDMDLQDAVWRADDKFAPPPVQFYCLMSVADCFTDFHIDFGGSSVYYHIVKGRKVFFFIPPTKQNLKKYEDWCLSPNQGHDWLGKQVKECYRVDLYPGDTMLIPSGWIHAVWTPEDSLVIGGNFLTRIHYGMQIKILEIEKSTKVALQFRYPFFQKIMWLTVISYLEEDPVPEVVQQLLQAGEQFSRAVPIYCEPDKFGHNSHLGSTNYNRRYYSKHELEGLTDLLNYIWRTVLISLDKIDLPQKTRNAVAKSIPKGFGDPLVLARQFAMWIAWKRGNENIPSWAFPDATLPDVAEAGEKKLSAAQVKKMERESLNEVLRATAERSSARIRATDPPPPPPMLSPPPSKPSPPLDDQTPPDSVEDFTQLDMYPSSGGPITGFLRPSANNPHITTPKTSQLGPKRVACDACRKRRIRCKHKDELIDTSKPGMHTIDLSGSYGISVKRRLSDHSVADGQTNAVNGPSNGGPIMADVNGDPYALKSGRVKACADCRKSKVRLP
jgi:F-box/leucine-rich repeat protein 10/11